MMRIFENPEIEIAKFAVEDVITTSDIHSEKAPTNDEMAPEFP